MSSSQGCQCECRRFHCLDMCVLMVVSAATLHQQNRGIDFAVSKTLLLPVKNRCCYTSNTCTHPCQHQQPLRCTWAMIYVCFRCCVCDLFVHIRHTGHRGVFDGHADHAMRPGGLLTVCRYLGGPLSHAIHGCCACSTTQVELRHP